MPGRIRFAEDTAFVHIDTGAKHDPDLPAHVESLLRENEIAGVCRQGPQGYSVEVPVYELGRARELLVQDGKTRRYVVRSTPAFEVTVEN